MDFFDFFQKNISEKYDAIKCLKQGKTGSITLLRHRESGRRFVLRSFYGSSHVYKKLLGVSTPNLPRIYEVAKKNGQTLVLEEYIAGDNLGWLLEEALCTPEESRDIARQLCSALWVLHSLGAVHRDVKPDNIILRGEDAVLIDFDASRISAPEKTGDTQVLGTIGFAAPEQYGFSQTDSRSDIYSLGVVINVMLTGCHPSRKLAEGRLGRIVEKCTMTSPDKRYKDILALMDALR